MSVSVGAFSSKSRLITAANWSSVSKTEKSSAGKKLKGKTIRPYRLTTNGFMWAPSNRIVRGYDLTTDGILRQQPGSNNCARCRRLGFQADVVRTHGVVLPACAARPRGAYTSSRRGELRPVRPGQ